MELPVHPMDIPSLYPISINLPYILNVGKFNSHRNPYVYAIQYIASLTTYTRSLAAQNIFILQI